MILGVSDLMSSPGEVGIPVHESGGASGGSSGGCGIEEIERIGGGGSRWPSRETLALLKIRLEMDSVFRDASHKAPLWDEVSRKMGELGFQRSAKKCREKFENVYKYHKRTKDGRASKPAGKTYRFFEQLEALENNPFTSSATAVASPPPQRAQIVAPVNNNSGGLKMTASFPTSPTPLSVLPPNIGPPQIGTQFQQPPQTSFQQSILNFSLSSSSTSSDEDLQRRRGRKRKWKEYLQRLMREMILKQEEMQKRFLETLEKRERERIAREESWRVQERARLNREQELLVQERSVAAAKDAAIVAFLQKITAEQQNIQIPISLPLNLQIPIQNPIRLPDPAQAPAAIAIPDEKEREENLGCGSSGSSSRWPKTEVHALIKLRTDLDLKYLETGPKGPLWEEISGAMAKLGYNRSSKRCKEKWENINKYYKKVKESNKKRPEDAKTCPYFHQLEAIYKDRAKTESTSKIVPDPAPIMARPEQQWPPPPPEQNQDDVILEEDEEDDDDDQDDGGDGFEMIMNQPSVSTAE